MPIRHALWTVGPAPQPVREDRLPDERTLEDMIAARPDILSDQWMPVARQVRTPHGGVVDLLAIAPDGGLVVIELKRDLTPRDVVAQGLDYASWVQGLGAADVAGLFAAYAKGRSEAETDLGAAFRARFGIELDEDEVNASHQIVVVAATLDPATERIVGYLADRDVPINVLFFQVYRHGDDLLLGRSWLIDPTEVAGRGRHRTRPCAGAVEWGVVRVFRAWRAPQVGRGPRAWLRLGRRRVVVFRDAWPAVSRRSDMDSRTEVGLRGRGYRGGRSRPPT